MTFETYKTWRKTTLKNCIAEGSCRPFDQGLAACRYDGAGYKLCGYEQCPKRSYYKTDGKLEIKEVDGVTWLRTECVSINLTPDKVRFLSKALTELSEKLDAERG